MARWARLILTSVMVPGSLLMGCAHQVVTVKTQPPGAEIFVNGVPKGKEPVAVKLATDSFADALGHVHEILARLDGYEEEKQILRSPSSYFSDTQPFPNELILRLRRKAASVESPRPGTRRDADTPGNLRAAQVVSGSGFLLRNSNLILTNDHVVRDRSQITVMFPTGEEYPARVVFRDRGNDLALIEAKGLTVTGRGLAVAPGVGMKIGETVHALGYPLGAGLSRQPSMVSGTISSTVGLEDDIGRFRTTAPINPGSSGGPIVNDRGQVMGVAVAGLVRDGVEAIRFGIKASSAMALLQQARLATAFDVVVTPSPDRVRPPDQIFAEVSPAVVLIEAR